MDRFIGPIQPSMAVNPLAKELPKKHRGAKFHLDGSEEPEDEQGSKEPEADPETRIHEDLPVGPARFDESGTRIDYTA